MIQGRRRMSQYIAFFAAIHKDAVNWVVPWWHFLVNGVCHLVSCRKESDDDLTFSHILVAKGRHAVNSIYRHRNQAFQHFHAHQSIYEPKFGEYYTIIQNAFMTVFRHEREQISF